jgi:hypothetical protein
MQGGECLSGEIESCDVGVICRRYIKNVDSLLRVQASTNMSTTGNTFQQLDMSKSTLQMLETLKNGKRITKEMENVTFEEFVQGFIAWRERTTTSPSNRHLGHYKLLTKLNVYDKSNKDINCSHRILYFYIIRCV